MATSVCHRAYIPRSRNMVLKPSYICFEHTCPILKFLRIDGHMYMHCARGFVPGLFSCVGLSLRSHRQRARPPSRRPVTPIMAPVTRHAGATRDQPASGICGIIHFSILTAQPLVRTLDHRRHSIPRTPEPDGDADGVGCTDTKPRLQKNSHVFVYLTPPCSVS